ncbi:E3 ubiquitin-protein ligase TRIM39-like [Pseudochaenichthys georgianus]|uniref:E3 ubiquitin-protein ligase TRIM39-like n=1 Tax=Pseudochaenichthys georgianus TaxID=52239 RepID=UPI001469CCBF|nr:E3 ubiquitin-protein ligase TRIM21-like [Pseudochaenichthys georgianus]XP_033961937.1 E3 ubiquitin-protein ligase TRIM21-like [Pseudochaenichthys georgianus]
MAFALSEDQFQCSICLDMFRNPVSIPCGHNYCLGCIKRFWDTKQKFECPLCKEDFKTRPDLRVNVGLRDITDQFKKSIKGQPEYKPVPPKRTVPRRPQAEEVSCDICQGTNIKAVKSCLVCQASYCEIHLTPHRRDPPLMKHRLTDPAIFATSHLCRSHNMILDMFCKRDQTPVCVKCRERDHRNHESVPIEKESKRVRTQMKKMEAEFNQMVQARSRKLEEINASAELRNINKERQIQTSIQVVTGVMSVIEREQSLLVEEIEQKHDAAERTKEEFIKDLGQEINEVRKRRSELKHLENTEDPLHLLQSFPSLRAPLAAKDWSQVRVYSDNIGTLRRSFTKLVDVCQALEKNLSAEEMSKASQYAVDVTLDPVTASAWLCLSADGKQVSLSSQQKNPPPPDEPRRFDSCVSVLGKQSFTSGRRYWVVQVGDKSDWDLGVARESINRKGVITVRPDTGYWAICLRTGIEFKACAGPSVALHLQEKPQKVAVFLDYEEGSVSFYNADAKTHIYTFTGCLFTEPLYPYLNPCLHNNGKNTAPLIICPVEVGTPAEINLAF